MMIFHSKQNKLSVNEIHIIKINGMPIERVTEFKFLVVLIDYNLTWSPHCNYIANKLLRICGVVSRLKHYVPTHILTIIYDSLFLTHIRYGITSWCFNTCTRISKLQKKVIIFLTNSKFNSHTEPLFKQLGLLKAADFKLACFKILYKYENSKLPSYFNGMFVLQHDNVVILWYDPEGFTGLLNVSIVRKKSFHTTMSAISKLNTPIQSSAVFVLYIKSLN